ncbi:hypothetical protein QBC46DRAFT_265000 [Diplogelasinospora grovesii]|uniref:Calcineurin-like phosphoesterase domain-containing protein n=1 Tax=Diplogelasinospora grovesii TaxID=303347 RepID=A0AAN6N6H1_9PEZI|nr:hypothetical protein QBC46DRAFT_265000 [Diplogelasinospora grovesii]
MFDPVPEGLGAFFDGPSGSRPSLFWQFVRTPVIAIARLLYSLLPTAYKLPPLSVSARPVSVCCISDTHNCQPALPYADILVHAGNLTKAGTYEELQSALRWLNSQPHPYKFAVGGSRDILLALNDPIRAHAHHISPRAAFMEYNLLNWGNVIYLATLDGVTVIIDGRPIRIHGRPHSINHLDTHDYAFHYLREHGPRMWKNSWVPEGLEILVTHGAPMAHLDGVPGYGCAGLTAHLWGIRPKLHVFGHEHDGYGMEILTYNPLQRAYEKAVASGGGIWRLLVVIWEFIGQLTWGRNVLWGPKTVLVNASHVGGVRDEERRMPIRVYI